MATFTSRLGLKRPDVTDPVLTQDFYDNYTLLDAAPGSHICTSTTKPNWGVNQAGRSIWMSDLKYTEFWDGSNWVEPIQSAPGRFISLSASVEVSRNTTVTYDLGSFTASRPAFLMLFCVTQMALWGSRRQQMTIRPTVNSVDASGSPSNWRHTGDGTSGVWYHNNIVSLASANISPGTVNLGVKLTVGTDADPVLYRGTRITAIMSRQANEN